jgi:hypothetical protein
VIEVHGAKRCNGGMTKRVVKNGPGTNNAMDVQMGRDVQFPPLFSGKDYDSMQNR